MKNGSKGANIERIRIALLSWYQACRRDLPWRQTKDPYRIWVSEVMLQQTQVVTVIPYYEAFIREFPDIKTLAEADFQEVLKVWEGLGYYARARNLHRAAKMVLADHDGQVPSEPKALSSLPGIGKYIGSALMSIVFGHPHAVVDGNVKRLFSRLFMLDDPVNVSGSNALFESRAKRLLDPAHPGDFNQAVMELGARICRPRNPKCFSCPLKPFCKALARRQVSEYPKRLKRSKVPLYAVVIGVVFHKGRVLILRRKDDGLLGGLWEFPGGKIRTDETPEKACLREIREEVDLSVGLENRLTRIRHGYTHFKIVADIFICRYLSGRVHRKGSTAHRWVRIRDLQRYPIPGANRKFIPMLKDIAL
jgi:A/G-specific adenine glycosylase